MLVDNSTKSAPGSMTDNLVGYDSQKLALSRTPVGFSHFESDSSSNLPREENIHRELNGSRGPGRQLDRYRAPPMLLTPA